MTRYKKTYKFTCERCGKKRQSVKKNQTICQTCLIWTAPGKGQKTIFGEVIE